MKYLLKFKQRHLEYFIEPLDILSKIFKCLHVVLVSIMYYNVTSGLISYIW